MSGGLWTRHLSGSIPDAGAILMQRPFYDHYWRVKTRLPERKGQACRVLVRSGRMNSVLVEFADGTLVVTSRNYVRAYARAKIDLFTEGVRLDEEAPR